MIIINLSNIQKGAVFKNYKELCQALDEKPSNGNTKKAQFKEWERFFSYIREGNKITITEVFSKPKEKIDLRTQGNNKFTEPLSITNPLLAAEWDTEKNGKLHDQITRTTKEEYWWICKKCKLNILAPPIKRLKGLKNISDKHITCPYCSLSKGAKKIYTFLDYLNIKFTKEVTFKDLKGINGHYLRFDFGIIHNDQIAALIEYDGEFHDSKYENKKQLLYDKMKDEYCKNNNIPFIRINHKQISDTYLILAKFFLERNYLYGRESL